MYKKGTPEYEAWIITDKYRLWRERISTYRKSHPEVISTTRPSVRRKLSKWLKEYYSNPDRRKEAAENIRGDRNPMRRPEVASKTSASKMGKSNAWMNGCKNPMHRPEVKAKFLGDKNPMKRPEVRSKFKGERNPNWNDGSSFYPYCSLFDREYRRRIRRDFHNKCCVCGLSGEDNRRELDVHHIHYDKGAGCNGRGLECVPLCEEHHKMTYNKPTRIWWEKYFEQRLWNIYGWKLDGEAT